MNYGIVEEAGKDVKKVKKGDRVIVPFPISCGHCWYCEHDLWSQCDNSNQNGEVGGIFGLVKPMEGMMEGRRSILEYLMQMLVRQLYLKI
jgi:S-(hydroxymethyl)glutathione dehydrogenase/alcohol dehydrogenase